MRLDAGGAYVKKKGGEPTNARAVLERALRGSKGAGSRELWTAYLQLESTYGSPASLRAIEERRAAALPAARGAVLRAAPPRGGASRCTPSS